MIGQYVFKSAWIGGSLCLCMLLAVQIFGHTTVEAYLRYYMIGFAHWLPYGLPEFLARVKASLLQAI
ncbi:hypothetical protein [Aestuariivirga litoralis]|uniref:hypothetical protein n=1 Tax=Aestuariivirga litoralis TaxID=2650924 RepID=UPI0018C55F5F|nr:hypothetical protein [Aestuariivirga litoralis]MBG1231255.1 hypothetical protein [Aestuariivirga litoralis]